MRLCLILMLITGCAARAYAQQEDNPLSIGGFVDAYYAYEFTKPPSRDRSFTTQPLRHNEFNINLALIDVVYNDDRTRGRIALQSGTYVDANYGAEPATLQRIHEGYLGFRLGATSWWVDMGLLGSHIGFESAISLNNWAYSRALMADFSPFFETGIKLSGPLSDNAMFGFVLVNGWQNIAETNDDKAVGTKLQVQPDDRLLFNWSTFIGNEAPDSTSAEPRIFNNFFGQFRLNDRVEAALIFDAGLQKQHPTPATSAYKWWYAIAFYTRFTVMPTVRLTGRLEYYADRNQIIVQTGTPNGFQTFGASVNLDYAPADNFLWRIEGRLFNSKDAVYPSSSGFDRASGFITTSFAISVY